MKSKLLGFIAGFLLCPLIVWASLETGTYISDLVITNPTGSDNSSTADDHMRLIKKTIKNTFPNLTGAVTSSHGEINELVGSGYASFTATLTGMTAATTGTVKYAVIGRNCMLSSQGISGTSNAVTMTLTGIPTACRPASTVVVVPSHALVDNSNVILGEASIASSTITFSVLRTDSVANRISANSLSFTNSGTKGLGAGWTLVYPLN